MNSRRIPVQLRWLSMAERGRKAPPRGPKYSATIRLISAPALSDEWSISLDDLRTSKSESSATMSFVSDLAPAEYFRPGVPFQLFEGRWPVAEGRVCPTGSPV